MYSIGYVQDPRKDDPRFETQEAAEIAAVDMSRKTGNAIAVWDDVSGEILMLAFEGIAYRS